MTDNEWDELRAAYGPTMTAFLGRHGGAGVMLRAARLLREAEGPTTLRAWAVGMNPLLGERAPLEVAPTDPDAVWRAALHLRANG